LQQRSLIIVGLVSIAYALSLNYIGGPSNPHLIIASLLLVGACLFKYLPVFAGAPVVWSRAHTLMCAYVLWLVVLVYTSTLAENSIIFAWLLSTMVMVALVTADIESRAWYTALGMFAITGLASAIWGIGEFAVTGRRANGPVMDPSSWCAIINLFLFAMVYAALTLEKRRQAGMALAALAVFAVAAFSAYSRVGALVTFAGVGLAIILCARIRRFRGRLVVITVIVVASFSVVHLRATTDQASNDEGYTLNLQKKGWSERLAMWHAGWEIYRDHPWFGSGPGTFKVQYPKYRSHGDTHNLGNFVHNDYLEYLLEGGPVLLAFLVGFSGFLIFKLFSSGWRLVRGDEDGVESVLLSVAAGSVLVASLMSFPLFQMQTQMMVGLLFARLLKVGGLPGPRRIALSSPRLVQGGAVLGATFVCLIPVLDWVSSDLVLQQHSIPILDDITRDSASYVGTMSMLTRIRSQNSTNRFAMATIYRSSFDDSTNPADRKTLAIAAAMEYQAGLALNPYHDKARRYFAEFLEQNPWLMQVRGIQETPDALYREGIALYPVYIESYLDYATYLRRQGKADEAYRLLSRDALPWADLRHGAYYPARHALFMRLLPQAKARSDRTTLQRMLSVM